ncbi:MAG: zinc-ribbon domain containing protein [Pyrinomonadaceae bacterium]
MSDFKDKTDAPDNSSDSGFADLEIRCIDCGNDFVWTSGEQEFFRDKGLKHEPKRCRDCKKAKNDRIEAASKFSASSKIEVAVNCDQCGSETTVPFFPSQGRPVLCRSCFLKSR